jgi:hypothetical protein
MGSPPIDATFKLSKRDVSVAPLMVVTPILQLSLVFRLFLSQLINRDHEVMNTAVLIGAFTAVLGSILVSLDTEERHNVAGPATVARRLPALPPRRPLSSGGQECASRGGWILSC